MRCPVCHHLENRVLESRSAESGQSVRRRRECLKCTHRFTTYERIEFAPIVVIKQGGERESFDRAKLLREVIRSCDRRNVLDSEIEGLVSGVEADLQQRTHREIESREISELVLQRLRSLSEVAYIRYASIYCDFENVEGFVETLGRLRSDSTDLPSEPTAVGELSSVETESAEPSLSLLTDR
ncbi:transcriptional regulator NrdR [Myxacorys almedinensis]|uniref:Transcriptional repressor NrdR n=1 Tax=Myxacorys almedinensis A TaxID=2690445 RepID=A0A8J7YW85_9CYAN|nr:transcriptional regulator NrdR [Myxacorys almedinensis]NDJ15772.1 transcriptional repressor NrdR [Myxacorys almedinensis A]